MNTTPDFALAIAIESYLDLLENKYVVSVPGDGFGAPNNIRFSYAASEQNINDAMDALIEILNKIN